MSILTDRIALLIDLKDLSVSKVETLAGLKKDTMNKWDNSLPSYDKVLSVAKVFDVSVDYLLGNSDNPQSHKQKVAGVPVALEVSKAISTLSASVSACFEQTDEHVKRLLQANGITPPEDK